MLCVCAEYDNEAEIIEHLKKIGSCRDKRHRPTFIFVFTLEIINRRILIRNSALFNSFIDLEKAFSNVHRPAIIKHFDRAWISN